MKIISKDHIIKMHEKMIESFGGIQGIRDIGLLESAIYNPFQKFGGKFLYDSIEKQASQLGYGLITNHPFLDGNKRIGMHIMLVFLRVNNVNTIYFTSKDLVDIAIGIASGNKNVDDLYKWITNNTRD